MEHKKMVKHVVTFKFTGTPSQRRTVAEAFRDALVALPEQIEQLKSIEVGINENPAESWDLVLTAMAETLEDVAIYSVHPAHVAAVQIIAGHKADRACVDYEIKS
ncbi:MAG: Dabb family protein [Bacteroides sp.]|nr:Dabb family protein [Bacteroides sp.]MCM1413455.1 Dabb family protein [Bacteroides sp.]MCM1471334.1 Dabb family protein [Bacteroides sp.]